MEEKGGLGRRKVVVVLVLGFLVLGMIICKLVLGFPFLDLISGRGYQAVFLTNGQVYFGHLNPLSTFGANYILTDVYYLQTAESKNQMGGSPSAEMKDQSVEFSLIKLGKELHGPQDKLILNKDHILFVESLKNESRVVEAINSFVKK